MERIISLSAAALATFMLLTSGVQAAGKVEQRMDNSISVIRDFTSIPETAIPDSLLRNAYGVAIIPNVIKIGLGIGGRYGKGTLTARRDDGSWSNPVFIKLGGGSFGWQMGAQSTDIVLVFKDRHSIEHIDKGKLTLGGDASVAAGPVGRSASAATDHRLAAEIYSYSRNRGLFAGVALDGTWLGMDRAANAEYYDSSMSPMQILDSQNMPAPIAAQQFIELMAASAPRLDMMPLSRSAAAAPAQPDAEVKTYAIEPVTESNDTATGGDETMF